MRAPHKAQFGLGVRVLPHHRVARAHALKLGVVDHIHLRTLAHERAALLSRLRRQPLHVVQAHRAVRRARRTHVLQVRLRAAIELIAQPRVQPCDVRHVGHHAHADGRTQKLRLGPSLAAHLDHPVGASAVVGQQPKPWHEPAHRPHQIDDARVAVASRAQHRVRIHHADDSDQLSTSPIAGTLPTSSM